QRHLLRVAADRVAGHLEADRRAGLAGDDPRQFLAAAVRREVAGAPALLAGEQRGVPDLEAEARRREAPGALTGAGERRPRALVDDHRDDAEGPVAERLGDEAAHAHVRPALDRFEQEAVVRRAHGAALALGQETVVLAEHEAADLDRPELGMLEPSPRDEAAADLLAPLQARHRIAMGAPVALTLTLGNAPDVAREGRDPDLEVQPRPDAAVEPRVRAPRAAGARAVELADGGVDRHVRLEDAPELRAILRLVGL